MSSDRRALLTALLGGSAASWATRPASGLPLPPVEMYNGRDLTGWHVENGSPDAWRANGEMISCVAPGGGYLTWNQQVEHFQLSLEYRLEPGGNSGIGVHYPPGSQPHLEGFEIQILDDTAEKHRVLKPYQYCGSVYFFSPPLRRAARPPGVWNAMTVRSVGARLQVWLNGVLIQDLNRDHFQQAPDKQVPLSKRPRQGCLGLQSHGDPLDFRRLQLTTIRVRGIV